VTFQPGKIMEEEVRHALKVVEPKRKSRKAAKATGPAPETESPATEEE
jgi:hypothetical protein